MENGMASSNNGANNKGEYKSEETNLVVRTNTDMSFNDDFFNSGSSNSTAKREIYDTEREESGRAETKETTAEVYETYFTEESSFRKEDNGFSYDAYEREKRKAFGEDIEDEEEGNFKPLAILLSLGAAGIIGYFGYSYMSSGDSATDTNSTTNITKKVEENSSSKSSETIKSVESKEKEGEESTQKQIPESMMVAPHLTKALPATSEKSDKKSEESTEKRTEEKSTSSSNNSSGVSDKDKLINDIVNIIKKKEEMESKNSEPTPTPTSTADKTEKVEPHKIAEVSHPTKPKAEETKRATRKATERRVVKKRAKKRFNRNARYSIVTVKKGDTLASIAERFYGNAMEYKRIVRANASLRRGSRHIHIGQKIKVPLKNSRSSRRIVTIRKGDTLASLAKRYYGDHTKYQKIIDANYKIKNKHTPLHVGQKIYIPR